MDSLRVDAEAARARGTASVPGDHPMFADHFPGHPILPGSIWIELAAQVAGPLAEEHVLLRHGLTRWSFLGMVRQATFQTAVPLPAKVELLAEVRRVDPSNVAVHVVGSVMDDGEPRAQAARIEVVMMLLPEEPSWQDAVRLYKERLSRWKARA